jgi:hypothetical protein
LIVAVARRLLLICIYNETQWADYVVIESVGGEFIDSGNTVFCMIVALNPCFPKLGFYLNPERDISVNVVNESLGWELTLW